MSAIFVTLNMITYCGLVMPYGDSNLGQVMSFFLHDSTKPLPKPMLIIWVINNFFAH